MAQVKIIDQESPPEILCPRCRGDATWRFLDEGEDRIEVVCSDCGIFEIPRSEFEKAEADIAEPEERR